MIKKTFFFMICLCFSLIDHAFSQNLKAQWIANSTVADTPNTWLAFRKVVQLKNKPTNAIARIAADSKYWLFINGEMVVFEGGLKRGPNPSGTYYDEIDFSKWLKKGENIIAIKVWYFGKQGFSHHSSEKAGLLFDGYIDQTPVYSDSTWEVSVLQAYATAARPFPNYRLPESSILYDARKELMNWNVDPLMAMGKAVTLGESGAKPWNKLSLRPIPMFKDFGVKKYVGKRTILSGELADTIICELPYNAQITPLFKIKTENAGMRVVVFTDNYLTYNGGDTYLRSEYITKKGLQAYESLGWLNGHKVYYVVPKGIKVLGLYYRETGYDTSFSGSFNCSDDFFNRFWEKAKRTLYLNMRDTYMDCPDRERAQWTGDAVNQSAQAFYALSPSSYQLSKKWIHEMVDWQKPNGILFSPVPAGNWNKELPDQCLATIGYYGLWNYYHYTGDIETLKYAYLPAKKYLELWEPDENGLMKFRGGDWTWGDWGDEKDIQLIFHSFYYLALKGMLHSANVLGKVADADKYSDQMKIFKRAFNQKYWTGECYRDPAYKGKTDDRVQALAVVAGLADQEKYNAVLNVLKQEEHASPYMEKYVMEALFLMNEPDFALARQKKRFSQMVNNETFTTLWEGWNFNDPKYGGGTINHSWSGGGLAVLSQYLCGVSPLKAGYQLFQVKPQVGEMKYASATVPTISGTIKTSFVNKDSSLKLTVLVPGATSAVIVLPTTCKEVKLNGRKVWVNGKYTEEANRTFRQNEIDGSLSFAVPAGKWNIKALK
ncbi:alpha-L-rhamnosidase-related protein [Pedobacter insulae]|uniref:alpha-L-rhamnosidase n=1 Tax=Pedobacter insulae TaxID=414048 RepID=A0A1I2ZQQ1_9SPHI|nr:alpha-L-rhamnosidase C-terminal domain-containing protein [Pedobacter insulae]SFH39955.1 alpha-L-rhamnosidase [Pedobacter insulae]